MPKTKRSRIEELKHNTDPTRWLNEVIRGTHHVIKTKTNFYWQSPKYWTIHQGEAPRRFLENYAMPFQTLGKNQAFPNIKSEKEKERMWLNHVTRIEALRETIQSKVKKTKKTK